MEVDIDHDSASDLEISLISPSGTTSVFTRARHEIVHRVFWSLFFENSCDF